MDRITIERAVLIDATHTPRGEKLVVGEHIDRATADMLVRQGIATESDDDSDAADPIADDLHGLTVFQLRAVATAEDVDTGNSTRKSELLAVIRAVRAGRAS